MNFAERLYELRIKHKLSQIVMSERLSISQPAYSEYERGKKEVHEKHFFVQRVSNEFDVAAKWLVGDEDEEDINSTKQNVIIENGYYIPKDFLEVFFKQQHQLIENILKIFSEKGF